MLCSAAIFDIVLWPVPRPLPELTGVGVVTVPVLCVHPESGEDDASWLGQAPALVMVTAGSLDPPDEVDDVLGSLDQPEAVDGFTGSPDQAEGVTGSVDQPGAAGCSAGSAAKDVSAS
jgi:hypothetical protein